MFLEEITFVVGAGASTEYGQKVFPVGDGLRTRIEEGYNFTGRLNWGTTDSGDKELFNAIKRRYRVQTEDYQKRLAASLLIKDHLYMFPSIDAFIDHYDHEDNCVAEMGKAAIAVQIARAESRCQMAPDPERSSYSFDIKRLKDSWLEPFARILMDNVRDPHEIGKGVSIICFNYDRCIEFYLIEALRRRYRIDYSEARQIVGKMNIMHPYGTLGPLPDQELMHDVSHPNFGPDVDDRFDVWSLVPNIKTYTERVEEGEALSRIHTAMADCRHLVFLGFGFTTENMKLLTTAQVAPEPHTKELMLTTGVGIPSESGVALRDKVAGLFASPKGTQWQDSTRIQINMGCAGLLNSYYLRLQR
ncbi:hypothetical protein [Rhizobium leguminosarum]|uniref:hypothetical protein n=1 Tax=Rhizobium leguminosarum TaxID=384 RepID=UPI00103037D0|nr:hypothetical protein [Rhizobium leguminosarum]TBF42872.1 hypothetical protein ELG92_23650 [Rhizobium leguminosarum]